MTSAAAAAAAAAAAGVGQGWCAAWGEQLGFQPAHQRVQVVGGQGGERAAEAVACEVQPRLGPRSNHGGHDLVPHTRPQRRVANPEPLHTTAHRYTDTRTHGHTRTHTDTHNDTGVEVKTKGTCGGRGGDAMEATLRDDPIHHRQRGVNAHTHARTWWTSGRRFRMPGMEAMTSSPLRASAWKSAYPR